VREFALFFGVLFGLNVKISPGRKTKREMKSPKKKTAEKTKNKEEKD
jgi:hypothetical protein